MKRSFVEAADSCGERRWNPSCGRSSRCAERGGTHRLMCGGILRTPTYQWGLIVIPCGRISRTESGWCCLMIHPELHCRWKPGKVWFLLKLMTIIVKWFYIVSYGLEIYVLNLLIGFLSPIVDPELEVLDGASLPSRGSDEFKPFIRRLPEFKFWYSITKAFCVAFVMTFFSVFDVPVFWSILLCYWIVLFVLTMKRQILHMIKYKYVPFNIGKQKYSGKKTHGSNSRD